MYKRNSGIHILYYGLFVVLRINVAMSSANEIPKIPSSTKSEPAQESIAGILPNASSSTNKTITIDKALTAEAMTWPAKLTVNGIRTGNKSCLNSFK